MKNVAPLRYDVIFKKAFSDPEVFTALVKDFLDIEIEIDHVEDDKVFIPSVGKVATRFDLFAEDKKNRVIVEVQHAHYSDTYERFLYYQCSAMVETIASSKDYKFPITVITLVFLTGKKTPSPDSGILVHDFKVRDFVTGKEIKNIYKRKHQLLFVFTNDSAPTETPEKCLEWMQAIDDSLDEEVDEKAYSNPNIQRLFQLIEKDHVSPEEYAKMKDEYNKAESENNAFKKGELKGRKEGEEKLREAEKKRLKAAQNLKNIGTLSEEQIASATGLSLDEVRAL